MGAITHPFCCPGFYSLECPPAPAPDTFSLGMIGFGIQEFFLVHIVALSIGHFNHSNIRVPLGPLRYLLNNPQMHTWHHARNYPVSHQYGVNFGISLSVWDYLFRTAYVPPNNDNVPLGYSGDEDMPGGFWKQALFPLTKHKRDVKKSYSIGISCG